MENPGLIYAYNFNLGTSQCIFSPSQVVRLIVMGYATTKILLIFELILLLHKNLHVKIPIG